MLITSVGKFKTLAGAVRTPIARSIGVDMLLRYDDRDTDLAMLDIRAGYGR